jgi:hypothetical protein
MFRGPGFSQRELSSVQAPTTFERRDLLQKSCLILLPPSTTAGSLAANLNI